MKLSTKTVSSDSLRALPVKARRRAFSKLSAAAQLAVTVPCDGEAHSNAFIDNCGSCANYSWGRMLAPAAEAV